MPICIWCERNEVKIVVSEHGDGYCSEMCQNVCNFEAEWLQEQEERRNRQNLK